MAIYNRNGLVTHREGIIDLHLEGFEFEDILNESPNIELNDESNRSVKFNYTINGANKKSKHSPRLKVPIRSVGNDNEITFIVEPDGDLELRKSLLGNGCVSEKLLSKLAVLAGGFAKFAVKDIYDAFYSEDYDKEKMKSKYKEFNKLSKADKSKYITAAKAGMRRTNN